MPYNKSNRLPLEKITDECLFFDQFVKICKDAIQFKHSKTLILQYIFGIYFADF